MKQNNRQFFLKGITLFLGVFALAACGTVKDEPDNSLSVQSELSTESQAVEESLPIVDQRFIPEVEQVVQDFSEKKDVTLAAQPSFSLMNSFSQQQESFEFEVEQLYAYEVTQGAVDQGGILLLQVSLANLTDQPFYYAANELQLSYDYGDQQLYPDTQAYPSESGEFTQVLSQLNQEVGAGQVVEGFLVYSISQSDWAQLEELGYVYLRVLAPSASSNDIMGISSNLLGAERVLYLPLNPAVEEKLTYNSQTIQDRLSTEWWGDKTLLGSTDLATMDSDGEVSVKLLRAEISDFVPNLFYEDNFQNFSYGQIIVSLEYEVMNNSEETLLPVDGDAVLQIGEDLIQNDYVLINDYKGTTVKPGESFRTIKSFALDRMRYQQLWQGEPMYIALNVPVRMEDSDNILVEDSLETEIGQEGIYYFQFDWVPELQAYVDSNMNISNFLPTEMVDSIDELEG